MRLLASSDIRHLETLLLERIDRSALDGHGLASLLVLVPTTRLATHLKRRIRERRRATLGAHILTHHGLATRALELALEAPPRILPPIALVELLDGALTGLPHEEASYLRHHAGARRALATTLEELREAGIDASRLRAAAGGEAPTWLADVYARFEAALETVGRAGWTDAPGLVRRAIPHVESFIARKRIGGIVHHGAYELTGANIQLVEAMDRVVEVEFLLPCEIGPPAHRYAERFVRLLERRNAAPRVSRAPGESASPDWIGRLRCLYAEDEQGADDVRHEKLREVSSGTDRRRTPRPSARPATPVPGSGAAMQLDWIADLTTDLTMGEAPHEPRTSSPSAPARHEPRTSSPPAPAASSRRAPRLELRSTQGDQAELRAAALRALALHAREGVPWHEIAIVARSLEPYAPFLESTFESLGVPFATSASLPLGRTRGVSTFLRLLRVYACDFERGALISLLRHGDLRLAGGSPAPADVDRWDALSREFRISGRLHEWRELSRSATAAKSESDRTRAPNKDDRRSLDKLAETLDDLERDAEAWARAKTFEEHAEALATIARRRLAPDRRDALDHDAATATRGTEPDPLAGLGRIFTIIEALRDARRSTGSAARELQMKQVLRWLEDGAGESSVIGDGDDTGVRVLDLMQARGLSHRVVQWLGFHHGGFPRVGRADPYLPDGARSALRAAAAAPIGLELEADDEERLLLSMTLASAGELLCLSFQRADEAGRKRARSTALREIARVFTGRADVRRLEAAAAAPESGDQSFDLCLDSIPVHCGERALVLAGSPRFGILPAMDVVVAAAVGARAPVRQASAMLKTLRAGSPDRDAALEWLRHVEDFGRSASTGRLDGLTGRGIDEERELSPTALELLAGCPQAFFLRYVLSVHDLDEEPEPHRIEVRLLGTAVHDTLEALYARLRDRGAFASGRDEALETALELLPELWTAALERVAGPSFRRLRGLVRLLGERWLESLGRFVRRDMETLLDAEVEPVGFETSCRATLVLDHTTTLRAFGRFDRVLRGRERAFVDDYKTAGNLQAKTSAGSFLHGRNLQLPLYREIIAGATGAAPQNVHARCLGVGPDFDGELRAEAELGWDPDVRAGFLETLVVCLDLARRGRFPLNAASPRCSWCAYRSTCRRSHEPTLERLGSDPLLRDYFDLSGKTRSETTLEEVRRKRAAVEAQHEKGPGRTGERPENTEARGPEPNTRQRTKPRNPEAFEQKVTKITKE